MLLSSTIWQALEVLMICNNDSLTHYLTLQAGELLVQSIM